MNFLLKKRRSWVLFVRFSYGKPINSDIKVYDFSSRVVSKRYIYKKYIVIDFKNYKLNCHKLYATGLHRATARSCDVYPKGPQQIWLSILQKQQNYLQWANVKRYIHKYLTNPRFVTYTYIWDFKMKCCSIWASTIKKKTNGINLVHQPLNLSDNNNVFVGCFIVAND